MQEKQPSLSLHYLVRPAGRAEDQRKPPLLLLLHGVGSNERDLFGLAPALDERFLIISVRSPITLGYDSYGWYHVQFLPAGGFRVGQDEVIESQQLLSRFVSEAVEALDADARHVYMMGFSQGAIMSLNTLLSEPETVAGVVAMSGRLLDPLRPTWAEPERLAGKPAFVAHGLYDNVIPIQDGRAVRDTLSKWPVDLTYREYPMGHEISQASFTDIRNWLGEQMDRE